MGRAPDLYFHFWIGIWCFLSLNPGNIYSMWLFYFIFWVGIWILYDLVEFKLFCKFAVEPFLVTSLVWKVWFYYAKAIFSNLMVLSKNKCTNVIGGWNVISFINLESRRLYVFSSHNGREKNASSKGRISIEFVLV